MSALNSMASAKFRHVQRNGRRCSNFALVSGLGVLVVVERNGRVARQPAPVSRLGSHHFRGQEGGGPVAALQVLVAADDNLGAAEVTEGDAAARTHQDVLGLQIAVDHFVEMEVVQSLQDSAI